MKKYIKIIAVAFIFALAGVFAWGYFNSEYETIADTGKVEYTHITANFDTLEYKDLNALFPEPEKGIKTTRASRRVIQYTIIDKKNTSLTETDLSTLKYEVLEEGKMFEDLKQTDLTVVFKFGPTSDDPELQVHNVYLVLENSAVK